MSITTVTNGSQSSSEVIADTSVAWYKPDIGTIPVAAATLLEEYSNIPPENLIAHVSEVRDQAWQIAPYPCIGGWMFLQLNMSLSPVYDEVLCRLKKGEKLLDLGCCFGQDIRKLVHDGAPSENLFGTDINPGLLEAGHSLFLDQSTLRSKFFVADIFHQNSPHLTPLSSHLNIIFTGSFFHLFTHPQQLLLAIKIISLLNPNPNSLLFGHHLGNVRPGTYPYGLNPTGTVYKHDLTSFRDLWMRAGVATGTRWCVEGTMEVMRPAGFGKEGQWGDVDARLMRFCVRRLE